MKKFVLITIILFGMTSCDLINTSKKEDRLLRQQKEERKIKIISGLEENYNITALWDTVHFDYTVEFQNKYQEKYLIIDRIFIQDIFRKNHNYYVTLDLGYYPECYIDFLVSEHNYELLLKTGRYELKEDAILVAKISYLKKIKLKVESELYEDEDYCDCSVEIENSRSYTGFGEIFEVVIL